MHTPSLYLIALFCISSISTKTIRPGEKVPVSNGDPILKKLVQGAALNAVNGQIGDTVWWVPVPGTPFQATKVVQSSFAAYDLTITAAASTCTRAQTPFAQIARCQVDKSKSRKMSCKVAAGVIENPFSVDEVEAYCRNA